MKNETSTPAVPAPERGRTGRKGGVARLAGTVCALALVICLFLPLFTATDEYREKYFDTYPDDYVDESVGMNIHELESVSPVDYGRIYGRIFDGAAAAVYISLTAVLAGAALLTLLFAALNLPVGALLLDVLAFAAFRVMVYDLTDRGVVPGDEWRWSVGYYLLPALAAVMLAAAIWMIVAKHRAKKAALGAAAPGAAGEGTVDGAS